MPYICRCGHPSQNHGKKNGCSLCRKKLETVQKEFFRETALKRFGAKPKQNHKLWVDWVKKQKYPKLLEENLIMPCYPPFHNMHSDGYSGCFRDWFSGHVMSGGIIITSEKTVKQMKGILARYGETMNDNDIVHIDYHKFKGDFLQ